MRAKDSERLTWLNYWSPSLWQLRRQGHVRVEITQHEAEAIIERAYEGKESEALKGLEQKLDKCFPDIRGRFIRLNRRSPKDFTDCKPIHGGEKALDALCRSMRAVDDVSFLHLVGEPIYFYAFEYDSQVQDCEFRCFVKDGQLIAVTQYEPAKIRDLPGDLKDKIRGHIKKLYRLVNCKVPLEDYVFDCYVADTRTGECEFLEINPYGMSDPCLFGNYEKVEEGGFAYETSVIERL